MEYDFGGYTTKYDVLCADGRRIRKKAFAYQNGMKVPLVWQHQRDKMENIIGHVYLEDRPDGIYGYGKFNDTPDGQRAKLLVEHGDIFSMSIFANNLVQKGSDVTHGMIREVSLVVAPANPGALIDNPIVQHGDDDEYEDTSRAFITSGYDFEFCESREIRHSDDAEGEDEEKQTEVETDPEEEASAGEQEEDLEGEAEETEMTTDPELQHADDENDDEETVQDVYDSMTDKQKKVVAYIVDVALNANQEAADEEDDTAEHSDMEGDEIMPRNVFDQEMKAVDTATPSLSHDQLSCIFEDAQKCGSLKESFLHHAAEYGIENIDILFPDAKAVGENPYMIKRNTEWVNIVMSETTHVPFSRIKSVAADLTADEARAKGYVKGTLKKEEVIRLLKRVTTPTTVYKKQKLDRDDIVDITELNVVAWLKAEMRVMLDEEVARAALVSDGREIDDEDKIDEEHIRPIWKDNDMYAHHYILPADTSDDDLPEEMLKAQEEYKGSGNPSMFTTSAIVLKMLLLKDKIGRRLYNTEAELASATGVTKIVKVPVMERLRRITDDGYTVELLSILVNLRDYTFGATDGGKTSFFDDFDIDYNQYKYLLETRCCGCLTVPKSAVVIERVVSSNTTPSTPPVKPGEEEEQG